jgi:lycopene cyclase domain-containing protein
MGRYTIIVSIFFLASLIYDWFITKIKLTSKKAFWTAYAILLPFQLLTNWWLTSRKIVFYSPHAIIGLRIASAPVEDLFFGFSLILFILSTWIYLRPEQKN